MQRVLRTLKTSPRCAMNPPESVPLPRRARREIVKGLRYRYNSIRPRGERVSMQEAWGRRGMKLTGRSSNFPAAPQPPAA